MPSHILEVLEWYWLILNFAANIDFSMQKVVERNVMGGVIKDS